MSSRYRSEEVRAALLADYAAGMSQTEAGRKHGVAKATVHNWVKAAGISRSLTEAKALEFRDLRARKAAEAAREEAEAALEGGEWVRVGLIWHWIENRAA